MKSSRRLGLIVAVCCLLGGGPMGSGVVGSGALGASLFADPATVDPGNSGPLNPCEQAGAAAEQANGLPPGLLVAIGRVESGKWDPDRARVTPWPWTINAAGKGQFFGTKAEATAAVSTLAGGGTRSIDVGCFQISLLFHPTAFATLEQAFDPDENARYATRFLLSLFARTGSWETAVEAYHSADPTLGFEYRQQVFATWSAAPLVTARRAGPAASPAPVVLPAMPAVIEGVQVWSPMPAGFGATTVAMPAPSGAAAPAPSPLPVVSYRAWPRR